MAAGRLGWRLCLLTACLASPAASSHAQTPPPAATPMVAPPRSIADITAVLDQYRPDPAKAAAEKAAADAQPAPGLEGGALAHFYYQRGIAAGEVGRVPQQLADLRHALELGTGTTDVSFILGALGAAEFQAGNPANAIRLTERRIALDDRGGVRGREFGTYAALVRYNIARGSLDEAARRLEEVRAMFANLNFGARGTPQFFMLQPVFKAGIADAETELALARGQYREAEASARNAVELHDKHIEIYPKRSGEKPPLISVEHQRDEQIVNIAVALREQGKLIDAEVEARRALTNTLKSVDRYNAWTAGRLNVLTAILLEQGRAAEGERLALAAIDILEQVDAKGSWTVATARQTLGSALVAQSRWADALASYDAMLTGLGGDDVGTRKFGFGDLDWAAALIKADRAQPAVEMTARILQRDQQVFGDTNYKTVEARAYVAMALAAAGDRERALQGFRDALPPLLGAAPQSTEEAATAKAQRLRLILDAYIRLLAEIRGTPLEARAQLDAAAEAFRLADSARGQAVQRALGAASARLAVRDPALAGLARREQDAGKQIAALEGVLVNALSAASDQQDAGAVAALRGQIAQLRQTRDALRKDIERRFPDYAALIDPKPAPLEAARRALRPGEALLATYVSDDATLVWAVPQQGAVAFAAAPLGAARLAAMVAQLRRALDPQAGTLGEIPPYDVALANQLYAALLKPVEAGWKDAKSLLVVPDKALAQLPFGVLVTAPGKLPADGPMLFAGYKSVPFLVRQVAITQLPSVAALPTLRALPATSATREPFIGFGDPLFNAQQASGIQLADAGALTTRGIRLKLRSAPKTEGLASAELAMLPRLPDTADEVRAIARALHADPDKDVFVGAAANEHTVETLNLADRRVIAFATHGLVPGDLNGLTEPALALSAPQVAHVEGDGLLTMDEVLALKLNADWVVLSACNTAAGDGAGAEAVSGLGRAFFYAGARALLVSNWPVETTAARNLTTDLFQRQAADPALSRAEALRQAELALIDGTGEADPATRKVAFSYAHPIFWAPFSVVGDGGASTH